MHYILKDKGVALIITLWVLTLLSVLAFGFSTATRRESASARNFKEDVKAYYLAVSAYEEALRWLASDMDPEVDFLDEEGRFKTDMERESISGTSQTNDAIIELTVSDEESRININNLGTSSLNSLLEYTGVPEDKTTSMLDSLADWIDKDNLHHLHGAENEFYEKSGYRAKNAYLDTPEELLLVKDFDLETLMPKGNTTDIFSLITTWGQKLNINTASPEILRALGFDSALIENIITNRTQGGLKQVPKGLAGIGSINSAYYRINVRSRLKHSPVQVTISAIVMRASKDGSEELITVYWKESRETGSS